MCGPVPPQYGRHRSRTPGDPPLAPKQPAARTSSRRGVGDAARRRQAEPSSFRRQLGGDVPEGRGEHTTCRQSARISALRLSLSFGLSRPVCMLLSRTHHAVAFRVSSRVLGGHKLPCKLRHMVLFEPVARPCSSCARGSTSLPRDGLRVEARQLDCGPQGGTQATWRPRCKATWQLSSQSFATEICRWKCAGSTSTSGSSEQGATHATRGTTSHCKSFVAASPPDTSIGANFAIAPASSRGSDSSCCQLRPPENNSISAIWGRVFRRRQLG